MALEELAEKLSTASKNLKSKGKLTEADVKSIMHEVCLASLEADISHKTTKDFTDKVVERTIGTQVMENLTPAQMVIKIVDEGFTELMDGQQTRLDEASRPPTIVILCGLQGASKTTHAGKLAAMLKKQRHRPMLVVCDTCHPAVIKQPQVVGSQAGVPVFEQGSIKPVDACCVVVRHARDYGNDILIFDTTSRLQINEALMSELRELKSVLEPQEIPLVVNSIAGQKAVNVVKIFDDLLSISGTILTKLDGDARGGAALSIRAAVGKSIKYASIGEKLTDLEVFHPGRMAPRIPGMDDVLTLIEDVQQSTDKKTAGQIARKMMQNEVDLSDLLDQLNRVKKMGLLKSVLSKLPGTDKQTKDMDIDERTVDCPAAIILSTTSEERENPSVINPSRKRRIVAGRGMKVENINRLLKQFEQMQKMMEQVKGLKKKGRFLGMPGTSEMPGQDGMPFQAPQN